MRSTEETAKAIYDTLISPNEADRNMEAANVVDGLFAIARALNNVAREIHGLQKINIDIISGLNCGQRDD